MEGSLQKKIREMKKKKAEPRIPGARVRNLMRMARVLRARSDAIARMRAFLIEETGRVARCAQTFTAHRHGITISSKDVQHAAGTRAASW